MMNKWNQFLKRSNESFSKKHHGPNVVMANRWIQIKGPNKECIC